MFKTAGYSPPNLFQDPLRFMTSSLNNKAPHFFSPRRSLWGCNRVLCAEHGAQCLTHTVCSMHSRDHCWSCQLAVITEAGTLKGKPWPGCRWISCQLGSGPGNKTGNFPSIFNFYCNRHPHSGRELAVAKSSFLFSLWKGDLQVDVPPCWDPPSAQLIGLCLHSTLFWTLSATQNWSSDKSSAEEDPLVSFTNDTSLVA